STTMISYAQPVESSTPWTRRTCSATCAPSLKAGITTETVRSIVRRSSSTMISMGVMLYSWSRGRVPQEHMDLTAANGRGEHANIAIRRSLQLTSKIGEKCAQSRIKRVDDPDARRSLLGAPKRLFVHRELPVMRRVV